MIDKRSFEVGDLVVIPNYRLVGNIERVNSAKVYIDGHGWHHNEVKTIRTPRKGKFN